MRPDGRATGSAGFSRQGLPCCWWERGARDGTPRDPQGPGVAGAMAVSPSAPALHSAPTPILGQASAYRKGNRNQAGAVRAEELFFLSAPPRAGAGAQRGRCRRCSQVLGSEAHFGNARLRKHSSGVSRAEPSGFLKARGQSRRVKCRESRTGPGEPRECSFEQRTDG